MTLHIAVGGAARIVDDGRHRRAHQRQMLLGHRQSRRLGSGRLHDAADRMDQARLQGERAVGDARAHHTQLQGVEVQIPLPDRQTGGLAAMPDRVLWEMTALVLRIGHQTGPLPGNTDIEHGAEAKLPGHGGDLVGPDR